MTGGDLGEDLFGVGARILHLDHPNSDGGLPKVLKQGVKKLAELVMLKAGQWRPRNIRGKGRGTRLPRGEGGGGGREGTRAGSRRATNANEKGHVRPVDESASTQGEVVADQARG
eukprot:151975_1